MNVYRIEQPESGCVICCEPGSRLVLRLGRKGLVARWRAVSAPKHLVPLVNDGHQLEFIVFDGCSGELRLERYRRNGTVFETLTLHVLTDADTEAGPEERSA